MDNPISLTAADRLYGLSLIWQEANYNFAFFDRVPELDWDAAYRACIPEALSAEDLGTYYALLARFTALLEDGHTVVVPPKAVYEGLDRPKLTLMNVENTPVVTNAARTIANIVPPGSRLLVVGSIPAEQYLAEHVMPYVSETTPRRLRDQAVARLLLGPRGSQVRCLFQTPASAMVELELTRDRRLDPEPWARAVTVPDSWEFMYFYEWLFDWFRCEPPFSAFAFRILEGNLAYVALNSFMHQSVADAFAEKLPEIKRCAGLVVDLRKNHGGSDSVAYSIVSHFLRQPTDAVRPRSLQNIAFYRSSGVTVKDTPQEKIGELEEWQREHLLCYRKQLYHEENWGAIQPTQEIISTPTVILTGSETASAAEDFLMAFQSGKGAATQIGTGTAGSTGQPLIQDLPGGGQFGICTIRMPWPAEIWQQGIQPDVWVEPAIADVINNEDRTLKTALDFLNSK
jgi:C-terminal processing protease CtpA/Prc